MVSQVNLGTWSLGNGDPSDPSVGVPPWISAGGTGLDCAWDYFNQAAVAKAVASTKVPRDALFITTKVPGGGYVAGGLLAWPAMRWQWL